MMPLISVGGIMLLHGRRIRYPNVSRTMDASLGGTSIPAPVDVSLFDGDVWPARDAFDRKYGRARAVAIPALVVYAIGFFALGLTGHRSLGLTFVNTVVIFAACGLLEWSKYVTLANVARTFRATFSASGFDVTVAFSGKPPRHYSWGSIRNVRDTGDVLVIAPKFGKQIVFPKRLFADEGRALMQFFQRNGVTLVPSGVVAPADSI